MLNAPDAVTLALHVQGPGRQSSRSQPWFGGRTDGISLKLAWFRAPWLLRKYDRSEGCVTSCFKTNRVKREEMQRKAK